MPKSLVVDESRLIPVGVEDAFANTLPIPLPAICSRWYGLIPPIKRVRDQTGDWDRAGQTRTIEIVGGTRVHEELTSVDPPHSFGYTLSDVKGPLALLVSAVEGRWIFTPAGAATTVTWEWVLHARSSAAAPLLPVLGWMWKGYARQTLETLSAMLTA